MHGQKRAEYKSRLLNPETSAKLATKAQQWHHLSHELLTQRRRLFGPQAAPGDAAAVTAINDNNSGGELSLSKPSPDILLAITEKMLSVNPDPSHLWNIRREMLLYGQAEGALSAVKTSPLDIRAELALTAHCLHRNPKSYSAWYHRKWSLVYSVTHPTVTITTTTTIADNDNGDDDSSKNTAGAKEQQLDIEGHLTNAKTTLKSELELCAQFLQLDERNFHCWNYRRFVVALLGSCGGSSITHTTTNTSSSSSTVRGNVADGMIGESDRDLFTGSWSSWLHPSSTKVSMGAQSSSRSQRATGSIPGHKRDDKEEAYDIIAKSIVTLSQQDLNHIIINEWNFTTAKIHDNFSNGSAFHYRSKLLPLVLESRLMASSSCDLANNRRIRYDTILALAREEWESILLNAIFTEPDDQTPWWYHRFIVSWIKPSSNDDDDDDKMLQECESLLHEMADSLRELLEVERENDVLVPGDEENNSNNNKDKDESKGVKCKWTYLGLHLVLSTILEVFQLSMDEEQVMELKMEVEECLRELIRIDPNRKERYQNLFSRNVVMQSK